MLRLIHRDVREIKDEVARLGKRIELLELLLLQEEELSEEEVEELDRLAEESDNLMAWAKFKKRLGL
jgi:hypothetical protein